MTTKNVKINESVLKSLKVLEYICMSEKDVRIVDLARALDINKATVYRLVRTFVEAGYIEQDLESDRYRATMKILAISNHVMNKLEVRSLASRYLKELSKKADESVHLSICDGHKTVIIDKMFSNNSHTISFHIGRRADLHSTGTGKIFLSHMPTYELDIYLLNRELYANTTRTITELEQLKKELVEIKKNGFAVDSQENTVAVSCVAGPIKDYSGKVVAAFSITGATSRIDTKLDTIKKLVLEYSTLISNQLGYRESI